MRRARSLVVTWQGDQLTFENYLTRRIVSAEPVALAILGFFEDWRSPAELPAELPEYRPASVARAIATLVEHTLLVREGSAEAQRDERLAHLWRHWLPQASFHFSTRDAAFASPRRWRKLVQRFRAESPQPEIFKSCPGRPRIELPAPAAPKADFLDVLLARKTHREFSGAPVSLAKVATLLGYTWGATGEIRTEHFGRLLHKTSPSGGARHPGEVYLVALDVDGLRPGIYHYNVRDHALEQIVSASVRNRIAEFAVGQKHVVRAAALFLMTAVWERSSWKYRAPRAYRVVQLDAGHLGQTFCLVATWLGLAPFTTAAMRESAIEEALGIDGIAESALYIVGVGMPKTARGASVRERGVAGRPRNPETTGRRPPRE